MSKYKLAVFAAMMIFLQSSNAAGHTAVARAATINKMPKPSAANAVASEISKKTLSQRVNKLVPAEEYPWLTAITTHYATNDPVRGFRCSGVLIHERWVLTTAVCVAGLNPDAMNIYIGSSILYQPLDDGEMRKVRAVHFHENFGLEGVYDYDYGLLELETPSTKRVMPIITPSEFSQLTERYPATTYGRWGWVEPSSFVMKKDRQLILSQASCINEADKRYYKDEPTSLTARMLCAQETTSSQDEGRKIFFEGEPLIVTVGGAERVVGVNSWINAWMTPGDPTPPIEFAAKVPDVYDWIMRLVSGMSLTNDYYFFEVPFGNTKTSELLLTNNSNESVTLGSEVEMQGDVDSFSINFDDCPEIIASGESCKVSISAKGVVFGDNSAVATVTTSSSNSPTLKISLRARTLRQLNPSEKHAIDLDEDMDVFAGGAADWAIDQSDHYSGTDSLRSSLVPFSDAAAIAFYVDGPTRVTFAGQVGGDYVVPGDYDGVYPDVSGELQHIFFLNAKPASSWGTYWGRSYFDVPVGRHLVSLLGWARSTDRKSFGIDSLSIGAPTVVLPEHIEVEPNAPVNYDPKAEDVDGTIVAYRWEQIDGSSVELPDANAKKLAFLTPNNPGIAVLPLNFRLTVTDNAGKSDSDEMVVRVLPNNALPTVSVTAPNQATSGQRVYLFVSANDPDSSMSPSVVVEQVAGPVVQLFKGGFSETRYFDVPEITSREILSLRFSATDSRGGVGSAVHSIELFPPNKVPDVNAGPDFVVSSGEYFQITATATDEDGYIDSYEWRQIAGVSTIITRQVKPTLSLLAPIACASSILEYQISVIDDRGATATDTVSVTVKPAPTCAVDDRPPSHDEGGNDVGGGGGGGSSELFLLLVMFLCSLQKWEVSKISRETQLE